MKPPILYADISFFGGCFDDEFADISLKLLDEIKQDRFILVLSATILRELERAPEEVRNLMTDLKEENLEIIPESDEIDNIRDAYLKAGIVGLSSSADAEHIAASVAGVDLIVSWNFKHIVHYDKIKQYHAVNLVEGYYPIPIHTPREVASDESENV